jgi:hypothetical protein
MMRIILLFSVITLCCLTVKGQWPDYRLSVGGGVVYGSLPDKVGVGINASGYYNFTTKMRLNPNFSYYVPYRKHKSNPDLNITQYYWELNCDFHYVVQIRNTQYYVYPLIGIVLVGDREKKEYMDDNLKIHNSHELRLFEGINIGVGGQFKVNDRMVLFADLKQSVNVDFNTAVRIGLLFGIK